MTEFRLALTVDEEGYLRVVSDGRPEAPEGAIEIPQESEQDKIKKMILNTAATVHGREVATFLASSWSEEDDRTIRFCKTIHPSASPVVFAAAVERATPEMLSMPVRLWMATALTAIIRAASAPAQPAPTRPPPMPTPKIDPSECPVCGLKDDHAPGCPSDPIPPRPEEDGGAMPSRVPNPTPAQPIAEYEVCQKENCPFTPIHRPVFVPGVGHAFVHLKKDIENIALAKMGAITPAFEGPSPPDRQPINAKPAEPDVRRPGRPKGSKNKPKGEEK